MDYALYYGLGCHSSACLLAGKLGFRAFVSGYRIQSSRSYIGVTMIEVNPG